MASNTMRTSLKRSALAVAMGLCFAGGVQAQTNTAGAVAGKAAAGDTITVSNPATGFSRTITVDSSGNYRFSQLPTGQYTVSRNGGSPRNVTVNVGTASNVDFVSGGSALDTVTVVGSNYINPIDVTSVESTSILTAEQINKIPVGRDTTSVALLAPGTVRGDSAFGNLASFGGASVAENQYYVNGFNVTNTFRNLNFSNIPFEAVSEQQTKTGGYGAEFGRSLGGVVNQITKRGTNDFHAGGNVYWSPDSLRSQVKNTYYANPLTPDFGSLRQDNSKDTSDGVRANVWASGALIKDRLFAYGILSYGKNEADTFGSVLATSNTTSETKSPTWLLKMDWNITDNNLLEFTAFSDKSETTTSSYTNAPGSFQRGTYLGDTVAETGGENYILKYTGYLTDTFTLSALAGQSDYSRSTYIVSPTGRRIVYDGNFSLPTPRVAPTGGCPTVVDSRPGYRQTLTGSYSSPCNVSNAAIDDINSGDERKQYRIDAEWQLGDHRIRGGYDRDDYESRAGSAFEGGYRWTYLTSNGPDGEANTGDEFDVARLQYTSQGAVVSVKQSAYYLEDSWNITDNFMLYLGVRSDTFENINGQGQTYVKIENQISPRLGFTWDVDGDGTFKVFGTAGRYALPLTPSVAVRGASASLFTREDYRFTGVDPATGAPTGATSRGNFRFINAETGNPKNPLTIASKNLDPMYQDEFILGFQKQITDNVAIGVRGIMRELKAAIDDNCDYVPVLIAGGYDPDTFTNSSGGEAVLPSEGFPYCRMFNPGNDAVFVTDYENNGTLTEVTVPGALLSPKAKRTYSALEFLFDGRWDRFFLQGNYTYARSRGNTEGGVKSDIGQGDTSVTQDFDYLALTTDTYGYLPNDRRHSLKLFGSYDVTDELSIGMNAIVQSGRPINCLGVLDLDPVLPGVDTVNEDGDPIPDGIPDTNYSPHPYGSSFMRCSATGDATDDTSIRTVPRGTKGRLPWTSEFGLNVVYQPNWMKGLQFKMDVFNILNSQKTTSVIETAEVSATGAASSTYMLPASFQQPRSVRLMVQYDF